MLLFAQYLSILNSMNLSIYVFKRYRASVGNKVLSFPTDLDKTIEEVVDSIDFPYRQRIKLIVLRQGNLVHYLYVVKIDADLVGFVFTMNGAYLADVGSLCRACGDIIAAISFQSLIITWSGRNGLVFTTKNVSAYREEAEKVMARLEELRDNSVFSKAGALPPLDYSEAKQSKRLDWSTCIMRNTIPDEYRHIDRLEIILPTVNDSVSAVLAEANKEADTWKEHYSDLRTRFITLKRQKKRMKWVVILALCLIAGGIILLNVNKNLNHTQSNLTEANNRINKLNADIDSLINITNIYLQDIDTLKNNYSFATAQISEFEKKMPIIINRITVNYCSGSESYTGIPSANVADRLFLEVSCDDGVYHPIDASRFPSQINDNKNNETIDSIYYSAENYMRITLRCYYRKNSAEEFKYRETDMEYNSNGTYQQEIMRNFKSFNFSMGFRKFPAGDYRIEIWHYSICLGYKEFTIY